MGDQCVKILLIRSLCSLERLKFFKKKTYWVDFSFIAMCDMWVAQNVEKNDSLLVIKSIPCTQFSGRKKASQVERKKV